jgi:hypothetical protein
VSRIGLKAVGRMTTDDEIRLANLRTKYGMGMEMAHGEIVEMLRLQDEQHGELDIQMPPASPTPPHAGQG